MNNDARFFIDHGMIHDRETGKHVRTDTPDGINDDGINETLALLNGMVKQARELRAQRDLYRILAEIERRQVLHFNQASPIGHARGWWLCQTIKHGLRKAIVKPQLRRRLLLIVERNIQELWSILAYGR